MKTLIFLLSIWIALPSPAQTANPVHWTFFAKKIKGTTYEIHLTGAIDNGWHTYSQHTPDGGPVPTAISFTANPLVTFDGTPAETGKLDTHFEKLFGVEVRQYGNKIDYVQKITLKKPVKTNVSGSVYYMTCNDHECLPPVTQPFSISLP